jgi:GrpB-like predicted nucleotidyltransferase (UPF0157 family)
MAGDRPPMAQAASEEAMRAVTIGELQVLGGPVHLAEYDPAWPTLFEREAARIRTVLGNRVRLLEHVGSTSVPRLAAKPIIDILLAVPDSSDEAAYVGAMEAAGYVLRIREPEWLEHRLFKGPDTSINVHVFTDGASEIARMLAFRDWLEPRRASPVRTHEAGAGHPRWKRPALPMPSRRRRGSSGAHSRPAATDRADRRSLSTPPGRAPRRGHAKGRNARAGCCGCPADPSPRTCPARDRSRRPDASSSGKPPSASRFDSSIARASAQRGSARRPISAMTCST